ncbi:MAG: MBL fold metallo-hydrolase RNA specificity domain-containing protein [Akkermansiaceae bacterium]
MLHHDEIRFSPGHGLHLRDVDLWLDSRRPKPYCFVSHAHSDHVARHGSILCSPVTAHLLQKRYRIARDRISIQEYHERRKIDAHIFTLLPAGHIAGSAMLHVQHCETGASLLYTGDYKLRASRSIESAILLKADTLIMESTFGLPRYILPSASSIEEQLCEFVRSAFADGATPVLLGYSLGKAQEIAAILHAHNLPFLQTPTVALMTDACRETGMRLPAPEVWRGEMPSGNALIAAPQFRRHPDYARLTNPRSAIMTGWALNPGARFRYGCDAAIPLSDHADFPDLLRTAEIVNAARIITVHGSTRELATSLRALNFNAWSHHGGDQLELFQDFP